MPSPGGQRSSTELSCSEITALAEPATAPGQPWGRAAGLSFLRNNIPNSCSLQGILRQVGMLAEELPAEPKQLHGDVEVGREHCVGKI